jgi:hypothetical protein
MIARSREASRGKKKWVNRSARGSWADSEAASSLPEIVRYIYSEFPMGIWGSRENVREHLASFWRAEG